MPHSYDAVLSPTSLPLAQAIDAVDQTFDASEITFSGELYRLNNSNGTPSVAAAEPTPVADIDEISGMAARWWGGSLGGWWKDAGEIYVRLFKSQSSGWNVVYNETATAYRSRVRDPEKADNLCRFLLQLCGGLGSSICIYDQESVDGFHEATPELAARILQSRRFPSGGYDGILIVDRTLIDSNLTLPGAVSTSGRLVLNLLKGV